MIIFSLLHPSRGRSQKSRETIQRWRSRAATNHYEIILSLDKDDTEADIYDAFNTEITCISNNRSAVDAVNRAAEVANGKVFIVVSDDTDCPNRWDEIIMKAIQDKEDFLLNVGDGIQKWLCTMPIMDRKYYNRFGYIYPPQYRHMFTDTHLTHVADVLKRMIIRKDILFPHLHYSVTKAGKDATTLRADSTINEGRDVYIDALKNNLGFDSSVDIFNLSTEAAMSGHISWLRKHLQF